MRGAVKGHMDDNSSLNLGEIVSVRGSVVDVRFEKHLPPIYSLLLSGKEGQIAIEVLTQLDAHRVRGIALTPTEGLARGMTVEDTGGPLKAPVGRGILSRMFDVFGNAIDRQAPAVGCPVALNPSMRPLRWKDGQPNPRFLKLASRLSMCWCPSSAEAKPVFSVERALARQCC